MFQTSARVAQKTILPIWKQLFLGLDDLMDGEIFRGCPAELDDGDLINHTPPIPTDGDRPQLRPTRVKDSVKASPALLHSHLTTGKLIRSC